jgi:hypothetical protein
MHGYNSEGGGVRPGSRNTPPKILCVYDRFNTFIHFETFYYIVVKTTHIPGICLPWCLEFSTQK